MSEHTTFLVPLPVGGDGEHRSFPIYDKRIAHWLAKLIRNAPPDLLELVGEAPPQNADPVFATAPDLLEACNELVAAYAVAVHPLTWTLQSEEVVLRRRERAHDGIKAAITKAERTPDGPPPN